MSLPLIDYKDEQFSHCFIESLQKNGFAVLINHPIDKALIIHFHNQWKCFFDGQEKYQYKCNSTSLDGYFPFGLEDASPGKYQDLKEYYYFYPWGKCPTSLLETTLSLFNQLADLGQKLLTCIELSLPLDIKNQLSMPLKEMIDHSVRVVLRILHYPPLNTCTLDHIEDGAIRAVEHEDLSLISLVAAVVGSGLQLRDKAGDWHNVPAGSEYLVINIGDMLDICTQGFYKATTHRVINPSGTEALESRYANAFFLNPHDHVVLREGLTAIDCLNKHIHKRLHALELTETVSEPEPA